MRIAPALELTTEERAPLKRVGSLCLVECTSTRRRLNKICDNSRANTWICPNEEFRWQCEEAIRNYDPGNSCATHFSHAQRRFADVRGPIPTRVVCPPLRGKGSTNEVEWRTSPTGDSEISVLGVGTVSCGNI